MLQASITVATVTVARKMFTVARKKIYGVAQCRVYSPRVGIFAPQFQITGYIGTLLVYLIVVVIRNEARVMVDHILV